MTNDFGEQADRGSGFSLPTRLKFYLEESMKFPRGSNPGLTKEGEVMAPIKDPKDALDSWFQKQQDLARQVQIVDDYIVVSTSYEYNISLSACDTHERIIKWAWQLSEKPWASKEVVMMFIRVACTHHHLEYRL